MVDRAQGDLKFIAKRGWELKEGGWLVSLGPWSCAKGNNEGAKTI